MSGLKFGVLFCAYNTENLIEKSLDAWIKRKAHQNILLAGVHGMFKEYHEMGVTDHDVETLNLLKKSPLDYLYIQNDYNNPESKIPIYELEHQVRNNGLSYLLANDCDYIVLLDSDEVWTELEIENMIEYVEKNPFVTWFGVEYKNLTFDKNTYTKGFCPPRIFKVNSKKKLTSLYWDNDFDYSGTSYKEFSNKKVPTYLVNPLHYTWLNDFRSAEKIQYQNEHFKGGAGCSFAWDQEKGLIWNDEYFIKTRQNKPQLHKIIDTNYKSVIITRL